MKAIVFSEADGLQLLKDHPKPTPAPNEALIKVLRAGVCSTDLEILKGYVPGFNHVLGHEFVGLVEECQTRPDLEGKRVVGEINCRPVEYSHPDPVYERNHAAGRTVLGIIGRNGCMAEYTTLPADNLFEVPECLSDIEAAFAEPVAAACRVVEQQVVQAGDKVAVIGDGKLGLLVAQVLVVSGCKNVVLFGHHQHKIDMVDGVKGVVVQETTVKDYAEAFDVSIEACGAAPGITFASAVTRPLGTIILKSTCSTLNTGHMPQWSAIANDVVVQEKKIIGSRCGPFPPALEVMQDQRMKTLLNKMVSVALPVSQGLEAIEKAKTKGTLKVQVVMDEGER